MLKGLTPAQKWVAMVTGLTAALALGNVGRAVVALQYASKLPDLSTTVPLNYFAAMGSLWGLVFVVCAIGLARFVSWGRWSTLIAVSLYQGNVWVNHLLFYVSPYARQTILRDLVLTAVLLIVYWGLLNLPAVRRAFRGGEPRK